MNGCQVEESGLACLVSAGSGGERAGLGGSDQTGKLVTEGRQVGLEPLILGRRKAGSEH